MRLNLSDGVKWLLGASIVFLGMIFHAIVFYYGRYFGFDTIFSIILIGIVINCKNYHHFMDFFLRWYTYIEDRFKNPYEKIMPDKFFVESEELIVDSSRYTLSYYKVSHQWLVRHKIKKQIQN